MSAPGPALRAPVARLYPTPAADVPLPGLYLGDALRPAGTPAHPCVYASFVASLGGRVSLPAAGTATRAPPSAITNARDWRLFQELAAAADVLVTSGRHLRDLAAGHARSDVPVSADPAFADLRAWREARGLPSQPALAIVTGRPDVPIPAAVLASGRPVYVATTAPGKISAALAARGVKVLVCGDARVDGQRLVGALANEGFGNIDMTAGGALLHTLLAARALDRLYLTRSLRLLGSDAFDTLLKGPRLTPPADFTLRALFLDAAGNDHHGQVFGVFDCADRRP